MHLLLMLGSAFLGGLLLNLMPCVLPVLSLKIFDFVQRAGRKRSHVFAHGLAFTAGTLVSFWALAGLLLVLRHGGRGLGWGYQLQSPAFLIILCSLFFFFSLHLFGVFELGYLFTRLSPKGEGQGLDGSFLAGVTATIVATPCTGPFMGTALAYAFTQSNAAALLVFTALALGMAFPYLLLSGVPELLRFLPKPGPWMEHLKQFMGFPLLATTVWLAWVFGRQTGVDSLGVLLGLLLLGGLSAWILGKWMALRHPGHIRLTAALVALAIFVPALILVLQRTGAIPRASSAGAERIDWRPFSPERLTALVAERRPVFIDFTADWCLSCKVNEKVALGRPEVARRFGARGIAALKADWTSGDSTIGKVLEGYGRNSIPLYVLYSGRGPDDFRLLPQVLTPSLVLKALDGLPR